MTTSLIEARGAEANASRPPRGSRVKAHWFERDTIAERLDYGLVTDRHTLDQAFRLQHDQYVAQGYMDSHPSGWRLSVHYALPSTRVFVARDNGRVVATVAVIVDSPLGLPMAEIYEDELREFRGPRHSLAEVSGLAVHPDHQKSGLAILLRLIRMVLLYSIQMADLSDLCIAVNPHHAAFYQKVFNFQTIGDRKYYGKVNGAPALALQLGLDTLRTFISDLRDGRPVESEVYTFLFSPGAAEPAMARLETDLTHTFPQLGDVRYFFSRHDIGNKLSAVELAYLEECWSSLASPEAHTSQSGTVDSPGTFEPLLGLAFA